MAVNLVKMPLAPSGVSESETGPDTGGSMGNKLATVSAVAELTV